MAKARVKVPKTVTAGVPFEVKSLVTHKMESGQRKDSKTGEKIPRLIINRFVATFNGKEVFSADWAPAISANPYMAFYMQVSESGDLELTWTDDDGKSVTKTAAIAVS